MTPAATSRKIVEDVLGRDMTREVWSGNYSRALPITIQDFDLAAVLPAIFYMFRYGYRRVKGKFLETYGSQEGTPKQIRESVTIDRVSGNLASKNQFDGFDKDVEQAILGDLLLCFCLENRKRSLGRNEQIQRVAPAHYMSSWIDLPEAVVHLRLIPEMIVALLTNQDGDYVTQTLADSRSWFSVGKGLQDNVLLDAFSKGITIQGKLADHTSDQFDEKNAVGIDELIMIRLAESMGSAPVKLRGGEGDRISNQHPIAERMAWYFSEDIRRYLRSYASEMPRYTLISTLESCMSVGLTTVLTSTVSLLAEWSETGKISNKIDQNPTYLFVDASNGVNRKLRSLAEQSFDDFVLKIERFPFVLMALRLLDWSAWYNRKIKSQKIATKPFATEWINMLGDIMNRNHEESAVIFHTFDQQCNLLEDKLAEEEYPNVKEILRTYDNRLWALAEALTILRGRSNTHRKLFGCIDSALLIDRPNGLAKKRKVRLSQSQSAQKTRDVRSIVFTDSVIEYLVHLHLLPSNNSSSINSVSVKQFLDILYSRYGFCIDKAPPGLTISNELLLENRTTLEKRLRDLGLLSGFNDAEMMKLLNPRFAVAREAEYATQ